MPGMSAGARAVGTFLTVLLHLLILGIVLEVRLPANAPEGPTGALDVDPTRLREAGEEVVRVDIAPGGAAPGVICEGSSYVGVGITAEPSTERIILVGEDTPAARAGLRRSDVVLNPAVWREARSEGVMLHLRIRRGRARLEVPVLVGRICIG
jgi:hypothetical protein